jgi:predicted  nucleic acid-binding Zn-ribbon protein
MNRQNLDASVCAEIASLEAEIAAFEREMAACREREQDFRRREDPARDLFFAAEIFELTRERLRIEVEIDIRRKKIRRRELGYGDAPCTDAGGLF